MLPIVVLGTADANIMMAGHVLKLGDLGCSCRSKEGKNFMWAGNVQFQPPETVMSISRDFKADVWAAGCVNRVCMCTIGRAEVCLVDVLDGNGLLMLYHVSPLCSLARACVQFRHVLAVLSQSTGFRERPPRDRCDKRTQRRDRKSWDHPVPPCQERCHELCPHINFLVSEPSPLLCTISSCSYTCSRRCWACHPSRRGPRA